MLVSKQEGRKQRDKDGWRGNDMERESLWGQHKENITTLEAASRLRERKSGRKERKDIKRNFIYKDGTNNRRGNFLPHPFTFFLNIFFNCLQELQAKKQAFL